MITKITFTAEFVSLEAMNEWLNHRTDLNGTEEAPVKILEQVTTKTEVQETDLRNLLSQKLQEGHQKTIAPKLKEYGAKNLTALDPKHWQEFWDFLISLGNV